MEYEIDGAYSTNGEMRNEHNFFFGKPEGKRPLGF
jgi:hypothetical protein